MKKLTYTKITSQKQYDEYCEKLLEAIQSDPESEHRESHIELLSLLINNWDKEQYDGENYDPVEIIKSLMDDHDLNQTELSKIAGVGSSYISEILNYKKYPSKKVIRNLSSYFKISQKALNEPYKLNNQVEMDDIVNSLEVFLKNNDQLNLKTEGEREKRKHGIVKSKQIFAFSSFQYEIGDC